MKLLKSLAFCSSLIIVAKYFGFIGIVVACMIWGIREVVIE